jgi:hypothetical protein
VILLAHTKKKKIIEVLLIKKIEYRSITHKNKNKIELKYKIIPF